MKSHTEGDSSPHDFFEQPTGNSVIDNDLEYIRSLDWSKTSIGAIESWSPSLLTLINLAVLSPQPQLFLLGPESIILYNTAYGELLRDHHPSYQGRPLIENPALIANAPAIDRIVDRATTRKQPANEHSVPFFFLHNGRLEEVFLSATMVKLPQQLRGFHATTYDTTFEAVQALRKDAFEQIFSSASQDKALPDLWTSLLKGLSGADQVIPFAILYGADSELRQNQQSGASHRYIDSSNFHLVGSVGNFSTELPAELNLKPGNDWVAKMFEAASSRRSVLLHASEGGLPEIFRSASQNRCYGDYCEEAVILPSALDGEEEIHGLLILGIAPRRPYDDDYQSWISMMHHTIVNLVASITIAEVRALAAKNEKLRADKEREIFAKEISLKRHEALLATSKITRMLKILQSADVGIFECLPSGTIIENNESFSRLSGYQEATQSKIGSNIFGLCHAKDETLLKHNWKTLVSGEALTFSVRFQLGKDEVLGRIRWVQLSCVPVWNDALEVKTIVGCATDISAQKQIEDDVKRAESMEQLRLHEAQLLQEALESKRQLENFIDITSHEIRNPLSAVVHSIDAMRQTFSDVKIILDSAEACEKPIIRESQIRRLNAYLRECFGIMETVLSCTMHQKRITDDVLLLSKLNSNLLDISPDIFHIETYLEQLHNTFAAEATHAGVELTTLLDSSLVDLDVARVKADPGRLLQVLVNLTSNAIKFTKSQVGERKVTITAGVARTAAEILKGYTIAQDSEHANGQDASTLDETVHLWFREDDTGCGMDAVARAKIFSRFAQASPKTYNTYGGSGLGLFVSMQLVKLQGGAIGCRSSENSGSSFAFFIKAYRTALSNDDPTSLNTMIPTLDLHSLPPSPPADDLLALSVLLVEDNLVNQKVLRKQLERRGYLVHTADNGQEALQIIHKSRRSHRNMKDSTCPSIDVILMDIEMPVMNGLDCTRSIREAEFNGSLIQHVPIIAVTANARSEQLKHVIEAGMDDTVSKPFRVDDLVTVIERLRCV